MRTTIAGLPFSLCTLLLFLVPMATLAEAQQTRASQDTDFFEKEVRPLLVQRCYGCHSGSTPKGALALDSRPGWQRGGASGKAIVPGEPDNSLLIKAIRHLPGAPAMPPNVQLPDREIALLARWIQQGAFDPRTGTAPPTQPSAAKSRHWAFQPLKNPPLPAIKNAAWIRTPIDRFVLAQLEAKGLHPNPPADRRTLIRRATYDLLGLPPTPAEIAAFVADRAPNAYEKLVDRLLASPHYGEKWGRHWLDVVHYGDTHGYDKDKRRDHAWPYRDYVIAAFNQDKPYARFLQEQIAGDGLFPEDPNGIIATGFLAAGPWDFVGHVELQEGTVEKEKTRLIDRDDMVSTVMSTFASMTVHCARCHDHKFDPIPQQDYYRLQAVFAGIDRADRPYYDLPETLERNRLQKQLSTLTSQNAVLLAKMDAITSPELSRLDALIEETKGRLKALPLSIHGNDPADSPTNGYHSAVAAKADETKWVQVDLGASVPLDEIRLLPARPTDFPDTPGFGFPVRFRVSVSDDPTFATSLTLADHTEADVPNPGDTAFSVPLSSQTVEKTAIQAAGPAVSARYVRVTATRLWQRTNDYVFALAELQVFSHQANVALGKPVSALDSIESGRWEVRNLVDNFDSRHLLPDLSDPAVAALARQRTLLERQIPALEQARKAQLEAQLDAVTRAELKRVSSELAAVRTRLAALPPPHLVYSVVPHAPRPIYVLARGDVEQKGEPVGPGALRCVPGLQADFHLSERRAGGGIEAKEEATAQHQPPLAGQEQAAANRIANEPANEEGRGRAALAAWLTSPQNMLTWRSIVNRVWHYHFGRGLVETPNDFGRNGAPPTHPELLDWLAVNFLQEPGQRPVRDTKKPSGAQRSAKPKSGKTDTPASDQRSMNPDSYACGGSLKRLHRLILLSAVYCQSSEDNLLCEKRDADDRLLWRIKRRRLEAEEVRDSILAISGKLDYRPGGPGFEPFRFKDDHSPIYDYSSLEKNSDPATFRRTVYEFSVRSVQDPFLESLDSPDPSILTPVRNTTLTALQALALRNDPFMIQQSGFLAERLRAASPLLEQQIDSACRAILGRKPAASEQTELVRYARQYGLANACRLLFNTNEFMFVE